MVGLTHCRVCLKELPPGRVLCGNSKCAFKWQLMATWGRRRTKTEQEDDYFLRAEFRRTAFVDID